MRTSVIIPTYNSAPLVVQAVESALAQTRRPDEIIVVDDGSTDDTCQRLRPYSGDIIYVRQANARVAAARNTGLNRASGDLIAFLDADDAWHPKKLQRQQEALGEWSDIGLLATDLTPWPGQFSETVDSAEPRVEPVALASLLLCNVLATSSIVVRRSVLDRAGAFDTELFGPEDYDLWLRCALTSGIGILREPLTGYRDTAGSLGKQAETMRRGLLRIHGKLNEAGVWSSALLRSKCRAHLDYTTGYMYYAAGDAGRSAQLVAASLLRYPLPMSPPDVRYHFARTRLLARSLIARCRGLWSGRAQQGVPAGEPAGSPT